jgi:hypothetical protein
LTRNGGWRACAALLGMALMVGGMVGVMWLQAQPVVSKAVWLCGALSVAGLVLWKSMLRHAGR